MMLASCKIALNSMVVYSNDRSKPVVPVLVLLFVCDLSTRRFVLSFAWSYFVFVFFSPLIIAITWLGEERANLSFICFLEVFKVSNFCNVLL